MKKRSLLKMLLVAGLVCTTTVFGAEVLKGNKNSKIYHKPACKHYAAKGSTVEFASEEEASKAGYSACKQCGSAKKAPATEAKKK